VRKIDVVANGVASFGVVWVILVVGLLSYFDVDPESTLYMVIFMSIGLLPIWVAVGLLIKEIRS